MRRRQAIVPWGDRFVVTPSAQLVHHLARLALERLPRGRRGPLVSRLIHNPAGILRKGRAAWRLLRHDRGLRSVLTSYRRQRGRHMVREHALLDDLLRLDLIRSARQGTLRTNQSFTVAWEYDAAAGALVAVSRGWPGGAGPDPTAEVVDALRQGRIRVMLWDHAEVAPQVVCRTGRSRWLTFTLGSGGVYRFRALEQLYRADVATVGEVLVTIVRAGERPAGRPGA